LIHLEGTVRFDGFSEGAKLFIDGKECATVAPELKLPVGSHRIHVKKEGYKTYADKIDLLSNQTQKISISLKPKIKTDALIRSTFLPGWGQAYQQKSVRSWLYPLAVTGLGITSYIMTVSYNDKVDSYNNIRQEYLSAFDATEINRLRDQMDRAYDRIEKSEQTRNIFYIATGLAWMWNMLDTLILPPGWQTDLQASPAVGDSNGSIGFSLQLTW
jgi:hypothetical protein